MGNDTAVTDVASAYPFVFMQHRQFFYTGERYFALTRFRQNGVLANQECYAQ